MTYEVDEKTEVLEGHDIDLLTNKWEPLVDKAYNNEINITDPVFLKEIKTLFSYIDNGLIRVAEKKDDVWHTNQWVKKAILLNFRINDTTLIAGAPSEGHWFDKVPLKFTNWKLEDFIDNKIRFVPGALARYPAYIGKNVVLMPSYINVGAYIGEGTMIDINASVGGCAQIGKNCHISGGALIGGVIQPLAETPVIIEDNCFIGACSSVTEGVIVKNGAVIASGVHVSGSTKIVDKLTGEISYGVIPEYSVVVPGTYKIDDQIQIACAIIIKKVDQKTKEKTATNEILRNI